MAILDNKVALSYVQTLLCHCGSNQQVDSAITKFGQHFLLFCLLNTKLYLGVTWIWRANLIRCVMCCVLTEVIGLTLLWSPPPITYAALTPMSANLEFSWAHWLKAMALWRVLVKMIPLAASLVLNSCRTFTLSFDRLSFSYSGLSASICSSSLFSVRQKNQFLWVQWAKC